MNTKNSVELIDYLGNDNLHALGAWTSTFLEFGVDMPDDPKIRVDKLVNHILNNGKRKRTIGDLINFLAEESHTSPFRFSSFIFGATIDKITHIQKLKHRVVLEAEAGESARYKKLKDKFYLPEDWLDYGKVGKFWYEKLKSHSEDGNRLYHAAFEELIQAGMTRSRAKESTRFFKSENGQIATLNKFSFDGVVQFYMKRRSAQKEVAFVAEEMVRLISEIPGEPFKYSLKAFGLWK